MQTLRLIAFTAIAFGAMACSPSAPSPRPTEVAVETPTPGEVDAIRFRTGSGLRADLAYVREVAADPLASSRDFGIPLLPAELANLNARVANIDAIREVVVAYTEARPFEFAGIYIDQKNGGRLTTMWTANLELHAAAIRALLRPGAPVAFSSATYTYRDLRALQDRISDDWDWMRAFAIAPTGVGVHQIENHVVISVSSASPDAAALILAHYAVPAGMIVVESDGTGAKLVPWGNVQGQVLDLLGKEPGRAIADELFLNWTSDGPGTCGHGDVGIGVSGAGRFELPCQAGGHVIEIQFPLAGGGLEILASGHVAVAAGATVHLDLRLVEPWPPTPKP